MTEYIATTIGPWCHVCHRLVWTAELSTDQLEHIYRQFTSAAQSRTRVVRHRLDGQPGACS